MTILSKFYYAEVNDDEFIDSRTGKYNLDVINNLKILKKMKNNINLFMNMVDN